MTLTPTQVAIADLHPHPRNYRTHPPDQLAHLEASIREHGLYRNVVLARDGTILAGHGVVQAASNLGLTTVPAITLDLAPDSAPALRLLAGDNEIAHLGEIDDRLLSEVLRDLATLDATVDGLLGTGFDAGGLRRLEALACTEFESVDALLTDAHVAKFGTDTSVHRWSLHLSAADLEVVRTAERALGKPTLQHRIVDLCRGITS